MKYSEPKFTFSIQLSLSEKERLEKVAEATGISRAGLVQHLVRQHLNQTSERKVAA